MPEYKEERLAFKTIFEGRVFTVTVDEARLHNGSVHTREVVHHGGGAAIVALNAKGEVALVRQYRYAVGQHLLELPAGKMEKGEAPRATALRELSEEAGLSATRFEDFGSIIPTCGYCTEVIHIFLATGLASTGSQQLDEDEFVDVLWMPLADAVALVMDGTITDAKTVSGLLRAQRLLEAGSLSL